MLEWQQQRDGVLLCLDHNDFAFHRFTQFRHMLTSPGVALQNVVQRNAINPMIALVLFHGRFNEFGNVQKSKTNIGTEHFVRSFVGGI